MWLRRSFILTVILLSLGLRAGATEPYLWIITDPGGESTYVESQSTSFVPSYPGTWTVELYVYYAHEDPSNPGRSYQAYSTETIEVTGEDLRLIFADDFETGTTSEWSETIGGVQCFPIKTNST